MVQKNMDEVLDNTRSAIRLTGNLEAEDTFASISIAQIFGEIDALANTMSSDLPMIAVAAQKKSVDYRDAKKLLGILRKLDDKASKFALYRRIRPVLKGRLAYLKTVRYADGKKLLALNNSGLIIALYQTVLGREPEQIEIDNGLLFLTGAGIHKLDLIDTILASNEARERAVRLKGLSGHRMLLRIRRAIFKSSYVNIRSLLQYNNIDFVAVLYRTVLRREPDAEAIANGVKFLSKFGNHKIDLITSVVKSEEAKRYNVKIKGLKTRKFLLRCKREIYRTPVLGYFVRWLVNMVMLPRRMNYMVTSIESLQSDQNEKYTDLTEQVTQFASLTDSLSLEIAGVISKLDAEKQASEQQAVKNKAILDDFYVGYNENLLPDSRESVKNGVQIYVDRLNSIYPVSERENLVVVDLGCGECEWVELLRENQYGAIGVDSNSRVVSKVRNTLPLIPIVESGALEYLRSCEDNSVDVLTSFHMVEHLELMELMELLRECKRVLKDDGILIAETPNPQNIMIATYYFNLDPTHKKPIPHELLSFIIQNAGFKKTETVFRNPLNFEPYEYRADDPIKDIVFRFNLEQAYAIWAVK